MGNRMAVGYTCDTLNPTNQICFGTLVVLILIIVHTRLN